MVRRIVLVVGGTAVLAWLGGCFGLQERAENVCGNQVIEAGEDCDNNDESDPCMPSGHVHQCRYTCLPDDKGEPHVCPTGWRCGLDSVCRAASGAFEPSFDLGEPGGRWLAVADFDGNGFEDIATLHPDHLAVSHLGAGALPIETFRTPVEATGKPTVAWVNDDAFADLTIPTADGLLVLRGRPARTLDPTAYASFKSPDATFTLIPIDLIPDVVPGIDDAVFPGDEPLVIRDDRVLIIGEHGPMDPFHSVFTPYDEADRLAAPPAVGRFDETAVSVEQLVLAYEGEDHVRLLTPAPGTGDDFTKFTVPANPEVGSPIHLASGVVAPAGTRSAGLVALHLNAAVQGNTSAIPCPGPSFALGDDHLDLLIGTDEGPRAAYGLGDGTFHADPCELADVVATTIPADDHAGPLPGGPDCSGFPLAIGDVDQDGRLDIVAPGGIWLSSLMPVGDPTHYCDSNLDPAFADVAEGEWSDAVLGELNGDGLMDLLVSSNGREGLDLFTGAGGNKLNHAKLTTTTAIDSLVLGDFDGNQIDDVAFVERLVTGDSRDQLSVVFGESLALPAAPRPVATLPSMVGVVPFDIRRSNETYVDGLTDLAVASLQPGDEVDDDEEVAHIARLRGRSNRELRAPFLVTVKPPEAPMSVPWQYRPVAAQYGHFEFGSGAAPGLVALAAYLDKPGDVDPGPDLTLAALSIVDDAQLEVAGTATDLTTALGPPQRLSAVLAAVDFTSAGADGDEPVLLAWQHHLTAPEDLRVLVGAPVFEEGGWTMEAPLVLAGSIPTGVKLSGTLPKDKLLNWVRQLHNEPQACQLGTGLGRSLLVTLATPDPDGQDDWNSVDSAVAIFDPETLRTLQNPDGQELDGSLLSWLRPPAHNVLLGFTCLNADADEQDEVALLAFGPDDPLGDDTSANVARVYIVDVNEGIASELVKVAELTAATLPLLDELSGPSPPANGLAAGDLDGDGVDDLVLGTDTSTLLLLGKAVNP